MGSERLTSTQMCCCAEQKLPLYPLCPFRRLRRLRGCGLCWTERQTIFVSMSCWRKTGENRCPDQGVSEKEHILKSVCSQVQYRSTTHVSSHELTDLGCKNDLLDPYVELVSHYLFRDERPMLICSVVDRRKMDKIAQAYLCSALLAWRLV